jgi:MFS family permease
VVSVVESRSLAEPAAPSQASLLALSSLNFFPSDMQTAFGPILAAYLALQSWTAKDIGFVPTIGCTTSFVSQIPGGELVDTVRPKRLLVATGLVTVALSVVILRLWPSFPLVAFAEALQGITSGVFGPAVVAIPRAGLPRPVLRKAWTQPALRSCRWRRGYPDFLPKTEELPHWAVELRQSS